jgi:Tfp pilus assembly protein PilV
MAPGALPARSSRRRGFALAELLLAAFILAVGLLGLGALQVATVRHGGGSWARLTALALALDALEAGSAEARLERPGRDPAPGSWPREQRYDREGRPARVGEGWFTVTVARRPGPGATEAFRAAVAWTEGPSLPPRRLVLVRLQAR